MRRFLLILLMCLLPLQSFAAVYARLQMDDKIVTMQHIVGQDSPPCHEDATSTSATQDEGCCKSNATCEFVCGLSVAVFSDAIILHIPIAPEAHSARLPTSFVSTPLAQPVKPPILGSP
jgi:hypothetical protein